MIPLTPLITTNILKKQTPLLVTFYCPKVTHIGWKWQKCWENLSCQQYLGRNSASCNWAVSSEFVSSSIASWQILTAHAQPSRGARDLAFCLKVPLDSLLVWASSEGSGETAQMRMLAWTFAARIGDKYQIRLTRPSCFVLAMASEAQLV